MASKSGKSTTSGRTRGITSTPAAQGESKPARGGRKAPGAGVSPADTPAAAAPEAAAPARGRRKAPGAGVAPADVPAAPAAAEAPVAESASEAPAAAPRGRSTGAAASGTGSAAGKSAARKGAPSSTSTRGRGKAETYSETAARKRGEKKAKEEVDQLQSDLRAFAIARPGGWNHDDWTGFMESLQARGHDCSDPAAIGARLERERLSVALGGIQGLGPKRVQSLVDRYHTLWSTRHASVDDIASTAGIPRAQAERVAAELNERYG